MKTKLLKRWNRGLLLAGVLVLALIIYVAADAVLFQRETVRIEQAVREYVEQSAQMAILPSPYNKIGPMADDQAIEQKMEENEELLRRYWTFQPDAQGYNQGEVMLAQVRGVVEYNAKGLGAITSAKGIVQYIHTVREIGINRAEVSFSYTGSIRYLGDVRWVLFGACQQDTGSTQALFDSRPVESVEEKVTPTGDVTAILAKVDGAWKLDSVEVSSISLN